MFRLILVLLLIDPPKFQKIEIRKICERKKSFLDLYKKSTDSQFMDFQAIRAA